MFSHLDAGEQKVLQDAVAALQRNDPALKELKLGELLACSWPTRALRLFLGDMVTVVTGLSSNWRGRGLGSPARRLESWIVTPFILQRKVIVA
jgi:hypothetical protein